VGSTSNKYQISSDGVVFCIEDDGTIVRLARVTEKGKVEPIRKHGKVDEGSLAKETYFSWNFFFLFLLTVFAAATAAFAFLWLEEKSDREGLQSTVENLRRNSSHTESDLKDLEEKLASTVEQNRDLEVKLRTCEIKSASSKKEPEEAPKPPEPQEIKRDFCEPDANEPFEITSIGIRNVFYNAKDVISDFGERIASDSARFLQIRIKYSSQIYDQKDFDVKIFDANGHLKSGKESRRNYTFSVSDVDILPENNRIYLFKRTWGSSESGYWPKGSLRVEIWSDNKCLKAGEFEIH